MEEKSKVRTSHNGVWGGAASNTMATKGNKCGDRKDERDQ